MMAKRVSARKTTFFKPKSAKKAMGYSLTNESFEKTHEVENTETR